jgi:hypothetical protein
MSPEKKAIRLSKQAVAASQDAADDSQPSRQAMLGLGYGMMDGHNDLAARSHALAAKEHLREASQAFADEDQQSWDAHMRAAMKHDEAAKMHQSCCAPAKDEDEIENARKRVMEDEDDETDDECDDDDGNDNCDELDNTRFTTNRKGRHMYLDANWEMEPPVINYGDDGSSTARRSYKNGQATRPGASGDKHSFDEGPYDTEYSSCGDQAEPQYGQLVKGKVKKSNSITRQTPRSDWDYDNGSSLIGEPNREGFDGRQIAAIERQLDDMELEQQRRLALVDPEGHPPGGQATIPISTRKTGYAQAVSIGNSSEVHPDFSSSAWMEPPAITSILANERRQQLAHTGTPAARELILNTAGNQLSDGSMEPNTMQQVIANRRAELRDKAITQRSYGRHP